MRCRSPTAWITKPIDRDLQDMAYPTGEETLSNFALRVWITEMSRGLLSIENCRTPAQEASMRKFANEQDRLTHAAALAAPCQVSQRWNCEGLAG